VGASIFPATGGGSAFVCKQSTAGQLALPTAAGAGVSVTAPDSSWGSWAQVVASSAAEYFLTGVTVWGAPKPTAHHLRIQVGSGSAGSETTLGEVVVPPSILVAYSTPTGWACSGTELFAAPLRVPISTRIAVRGMVYNVTGTLAASLMVLAVPYTAIEGN
jgi:hypothetical protein